MRFAIALTLLAALVPGQPAPDFTLRDQDGNAVTLSAARESRPRLLSRLLLLVLDQQGRIRWLKIESDYRERPTNEEIAAALNRFE